MTDEQLRRLHEWAQSEEGRRLIQEQCREAAEMVKRLQEARKWKVGDFYACI